MTFFVILLFFQVLILLLLLLVVFLQLLVLLVLIGLFRHRIELLLKWLLLQLLLLFRLGLVGRDFVVSLGDDLRRQGRWPLVCD